MGRRISAGVGLWMPAWVFLCVSWPGWRQIGERAPQATAGTGNQGDFAFQGRGGHRGDSFTLPLFALVRRPVNLGRIVAVVTQQRLVVIMVRRVRGIAASASKQVFTTENTKNLEVPRSSRDTPAATPSNNRRITKNYRLTSHLTRFSPVAFHRTKPPQGATRESLFFRSSWNFEVLRVLRGENLLACQGLSASVLTRIKTAGIRPSTNNQ